MKDFFKNVRFNDSDDNPDDATSQQVIELVGNEAAGADGAGTDY